MERYLTETSMLDFSAPAIENLIERRCCADAVFHAASTASPSTKGCKLE